MTVTTEEAAEIAGVSPATIRGWVLKGWLSPLRRGAKPLRFRYDDVARVQAEHRSETWRRRHAEAAERWKSCVSGDAVQR
jgi:predicted site-specific integrase-resolvase